MFLWSLYSFCSLCHSYLFFFFRSSWSLFLGLLFFGPLSHSPLVSGPLGHSPLVSCSSVLLVTLPWSPVSPVLLVTLPGLLFLRSSWSLSHGLLFLQSSSWFPGL